MPVPGDGLPKLYGRLQEEATRYSYTENMIFDLLKKLMGVMSTPVLGNTKMVFVVRTDLNMNCGKIAAQCAHGAVSLYRTSSGNYVNLWLLQGQPKIVLRLNKSCEQGLKDIYKTAKSKGLNACLLSDAGRTRLAPGTLTLVGIGPAISEEIDEITKNLKLL